MLKYNKFCGRYVPVITHIIRNQLEIRKLKSMESMMSEVLTYRKSQTRISFQPVAHSRGEIYIGEIKALLCHSRTNKVRVE